MSLHGSQLKTSGIACRVAVELGLDKGLDDSQGEFQSSEPDINLRQRLAIVLLLSENFWSLHTERPKYLSATNFCPQLLRTGLNDALLDAWRGLCLVLSEITAALYDRGTIAGDVDHHLPELHKYLETWNRSLSPDLKLDESNISCLNPAAYILHVLFYRVQIQLYLLPDSILRKRKHRNSLSGTATSGGYISKMSCKVIRQSACKIAELGLTYVTVYGYENFSTVMLDSLFTAAMVLFDSILQEAHWDGDTVRRTYVDDPDIQWLRVLDEVLRALEVHFPITREMCATLSALAKATPLDHVFTDTTTTLSKRITASNSDATISSGEGLMGHPVFAATDYDFDFVETPSWFLLPS